jgi:hypothetical protein
MSSPIWGSWPDFFTPWQLRSWFSAAPSLTRGRACLFYMLLDLASVVVLGSESFETHDHILLSDLRLPFSSTSDSQGHGGGIRPRLHTNELPWSASCLQDTSSVRTTQKTIHFCWRDVFTAPLPSNRRSIARVGSLGNLFKEPLPSNGIYLFILPPTPSSLLLWLSHHNTRQQ